MRTEPGWRRISWEEALTETAQKLAEVREENGTEAVAFPPLAYTYQAPSKMLLLVFSGGPPSRATMPIFVGRT
jgi:anaerobic selenocysteine-containing dehydrogenase